MDPSTAPESFQFKRKSLVAHGADNNQTHDDHTEGFEDAIIWPINRCCYDELKPAELITVEQLFSSRDDAPMLMKWVVQHKPHRHFQKRVLVISSFRLWLLKRSKQPFKHSLVVSKELQFLHLRQIHVLQTKTVSTSDPTATTTAIKLHFDLPGDNGDSIVLHLDPGVHSESIVRLLQRLLHGMRFAFPNQELPAILLPPQCHWQEFLSTETRATEPKVLAEAMTLAYRCFCDDLDIPYRASVTIRLQECLETSCVDFQYCLSASSGSEGALSHSTYVETPTSTMLTLLGFVGRLIGQSGWGHGGSMHWKEVQALARTLEHCHCFDDIVVYDFVMGDVGMGALFQALLSPSCSIKGFALTNVGLNTKALRTLQHVVLQATIRRSGHQSLQLRRLDFSFNTFSVLMAHALATILELVPSGLEILQLEQCRLNMFASARILAAMKSSPGFSSNLRELNLSGNTLSLEGTRVLALWITGAFALQRLDLSRTKLKTNMFFQSFKQNTILHESSLVLLDLSYNRMGTQASYDLGEIVGKTQSLSTLILRGMKERPLHPRRIVADVVGSTSTHRRHHKKPTTTRGKPIANGLRKLHLRNILGPMFQNMSRVTPCLVDLSENDLHGAKAALLAQLIDSSPQAGRASIRLDHTNLTDKSAILLLHSIRGCKTLDSLSLEGNGFCRRQTKRSYKRFHQHQPLATSTLSPPTVLEQAAGDALCLLLGGKARASGETHSEGSSQGSTHSFTNLYQHKPKRLPLQELSLRADGAFVYGVHVLTRAIEALAVNTFLQMLDVSGNECGDALASALGAVLPVNKTLQVLYWDDNFTSVDGLFVFYAGLLRNHTLTVVQLPINDTRRILEELKDPPREKLFSVLGKIFKVTERNQTLALAKQSVPQTRAKQNEVTTTSPRAKGRRQRRHGREESYNQHEADVDATRDKPELPEMDDDEETKTDDTRHDNGESRVAESAKTEKDASWSGYYQHSSSVRYPSTIRSWGQSTHRNDEVRASWDQISALSSVLT